LAYFVWNSKGVNQTEALSEVALEPTVEETQQVPAEPEPRPELALDQEVEGPLEQKPNDQFLMKEDENQEKTESYALSVTDGDRQGFQHVKLQVHAPVRVRVRIDGKAEITQDLEPNQYDFSFSRQAHFFIFNAAAVTLYFNDKPLGPLGSEGRRRSLSFHGSLSESTRF
jgi:hypothetical protein